MNGVDDAAALELYPDAIGARPGKDELEFDTLSAVREKRMLVHHIDQITSWVDGGIRRGNNPNMLPKPPEFKPATDRTSDVVARVSGPWSSDRAFTLDVLLPERLGTDDQMRLVAVLPDGRVEPLLWLHNYDARQPHPFPLRRPLELPAGTAIRGISTGAVISLPGR